jgi:hypothetical protein
LQLNAVEHGRSVSASVRKAYELAEAVVLVCANNAALQASLARIRAFFRGVLGLPRRGLVIVVVGLLEVLVILVVVVLVMVVEVHGVANWTLYRRNLAGWAQNTRGTIRGNPAATRPRSNGHTVDGHHYGAAA